MPPQLTCCQRYLALLQAFVITLTRAGEDKVFKLSDPDATFTSFSGADYDLNDAVTTADEIQTSQRDEDGRKFFDYIVRPAADVCTDAA
jgi:hypothetical protein